MNRNLAKVGQQLLQIWNQLGLSQRVSIVMATLVVLGGLASVVALSNKTSYGLLYGRLSDTEAARVVAALDEAKVPHKEGAGGNVFIPSDRIHAVRMQLAGKGIPRADGVGFEIFDKPNFGISDFIQRANYVRALQGELARTIGQLDDIESARVLVVLPENRLLVDKDKHPTASVFVRLRGSSPLQSQAISSIRFLVANSVEGLKANHVTVIDNLGNALSENVEEDSLVGATTTQLAARRNLELYLAKKAEGMLETVLGPGQAVVRVAAEINFDVTSRVEEKFDPEGQVIRSQTRNDEDTASVSSETTTGAVGVSSNTPAESNAVSQASGPVNNTKNKRTLGTTEYEIGRVTSNSYQAAGGIRRLSAAVTIASRFEGAGADRKVVARTPEELEKLRRVVQNALGYDTSRGDQVILEELTFNDQVANDMRQRFQEQERIELYWTIARTVGYPALALLFFGILLRLIKRTPVEDFPVGIPVGLFPAMAAAGGNGAGMVLGNGNGNGHALAHAHGGGTSNGNGHANGNGNGNGHGKSKPDAEEPSLITVDVLNRLVRENPNNVTQAIRTWLTRGAPPTN